MSERVGPPSRPPTMRPVDRELPQMSKDGTITHGSEQPPIVRRNTLLPWQRDVLMMLDDRHVVGTHRKVAGRLAAAGLVTIDDDVVVITQSGRDALVRGWYPA